jgi:hypothetical protein
MQWTLSASEPSAVGQLVFVAVHATMRCSNMTQVSMAALACGLALVSCGARTGFETFGGAGSSDGGIVAPQSDGTVTPEPDASTADSESGASLQGPVHAILTNDCGPTDGLVLTFIIAPTPLQCPPTNCTPNTCLPRRPPTRDEISLYLLSPGAIGATISTPITGPNGEAEASACRSGTCVPATHLYVSFLESPDAATVTGTYTLSFADGSSVTGRLDGAVCHNRPFCG